MDIAVVGSVNMDIVASVHHHPGPGETIQASLAELHPGGKGANQAVAAARSGARVRLIGAIGTDAFAGPLRIALSDSGVDTGGLLVKDGPTGMALITIDQTGENRIVVCPGANALLTPQDVDQARSLLAGCRMLLLQNEVAWPATERTIEIAHELGIRVLFNPAPARPMSPGLLTELDVLVVNETEAEVLTGIPVTDLAHARTAAAKLLQLGPGMVIVTLGADGALCLSEKEGELVVPTFPVDVVDTTAAGDTFIGALAAQLCENEALEPALRYASAAGALAVTRRGAQDSIPTRREVEWFLALS